MERELVAFQGFDMKVLEVNHKALMCLSIETEDDYALSAEALYEVTAIKKEVEARLKHAKREYEEEVKKINKMVQERYMEQILSAEKYLKDIMVEYLTAKMNDYEVENKQFDRLVGKYKEIDIGDIGELKKLLTKHLSDDPVRIGDGLVYVAYRDKLVIDDEDEIACEYRTANLSKIKEALKSGKEVRGARFVRTPSVVVRIGK